MLHYPTVKDNLERYIDAGFPILYIRTFEEAKTDAFIEAAASARRTKVLEWNGANGFVDFKTKSALLPQQTLKDTLSLLKNGNDLHRHWLIIKDANEFFKDGQTKMPVISLLKEIARKIRNGVDATVIIVSSEVHIPPDLEKLITVLEVDLPDEKEISGVVSKFLEENGIPTVNAGLLEDMSLAFKGLSESEIEDLLRLAVAEDGELTTKALKLILDQKQQMIMKAGVLEMVLLKESVEDIGGLENLKEWLKYKEKVFKNIKRAKEFGVAIPKGVLIAGLPGCGKSLTAKAAGKLFDVPLLRLDMGRLMGRYVGESEENMRKAIRLADAISPCVLWVDELEKAFAGISGGGSEVTTRLFGTFLTWMQEKTSPVFVVATANKINDLPPELLRKGRFDEIFYVDFPNEAERKKIFEIHIRKRREQDLKNIDLDALAAQTADYAGADIEGVVSESVEAVFVQGRDSLTTEDMLAVKNKTNPLSEVMPKEIKDMREEYKKKKLKKASR
jgi:SpoVK/Ycf46/Vps4 family AAA+-type ATPase